MHSYLVWLLMQHWLIKRVWTWLFFLFALLFVDPRYKKIVKTWNLRVIDGTQNTLPSVIQSLSCTLTYEYMTGELFINKIELLSWTWFAVCIAHIQTATFTLAVHVQVLWLNRVPLFFFNLYTYLYKPSLCNPLYELYLL